MHTSTWRARRALAAAPAALAAAVLAGCGGSAGATTTATADTSTSPISTDANSTDANSTDRTAVPARPGAAGAAGAGTPAPAQRAFPGTVGEIAEVAGKTLQVQGGGTQTAVRWTSATKVTDTVAAKRSDLTVGSCVQVRDASAGPPDLSAPDLSAPVTATSVALADAVDGLCSADRGGFGGGPGSGGTPPDGRVPDGRAPGNGAGRPDGTARPDGARSAFRGGGGVNGIVTKISGDTVTVEVRRPGAQGADPPSGSTATPEVTIRTVTLTPATTYTMTVAGPTAALKVGRCVTALGAADDLGAVTATSIVVRDATDAGCAAAPVRRGFATPETSGE